MSKSSKPKLYGCCDDPGCPMCHGSGVTDNSNPETARVNAQLMLMGDLPESEMPIHHLTELERVKLEVANQLLANITSRHCHTCVCELCSARAYTDVQEEDSFHVPYVPTGG